MDENSNQLHRFDDRCIHKEDGQQSVPSVTTQENDFICLTTFRQRPIDHLFSLLCVCLIFCRLLLVRPSVTSYVVATLPAAIGWLSCGSGTIRLLLLLLLLLLLVLLLLSAVVVSCRVTFSGYSSLDTIIRNVLVASRSTSTYDNAEPTPSCAITVSLLAGLCLIFPRHASS